MNYFDYNSLEWRKKRAEILRKDKLRCQTNFDGCLEVALNVHHINSAFKHPEWAFEDWNLISVCEVCHQKISDAKNRMKENMIEEE